MGLLSIRTFNRQDAKRHIRIACKRLSWRVQGQTKDKRVRARAAPGIASHPAGTASGGRGSTGEGCEEKTGAWVGQLHQPQPEQGI